MDYLDCKRMFSCVFCSRSKRDAKDPDESERVLDLRKGLGKDEYEKDFEIKFGNGTIISGLSKLFYLF